MKLLKKQQGFTLIELLIVIGVIAILAALAFVALNPLARFQDARNAERWSDVNAILGAIKLDQVDNGGTYNDVIVALTSDLYYQIGAGS
ncbi:type II secretion system GspH family protein, partial [bacterium]|nr:type II secretion system GspH family protein [bacterium]